MEHCDPTGPTLCPQFVIYQSATVGLEALERKEADLFIGALTRAGSREAYYNIRFTTGYYAFESNLYANSTGQKKNAKEWLSVADRSIGVVQNSTNNWLATELAAEDIEGHTVSVVTFKSVPDLEAALDREEVDGVLLDDVVDNGPEGVRQIKGVQNMEAWNRFKARLGSEGYETFAIAVAASDSGGAGGATAPCAFSLGWIARMTHVRALADDTSSIYCPVEQALTENYVPKLKTVLRENYGIKSAIASDGKLAEGR